LTSANRRPTCRHACGLPSAICLAQLKLTFIREEHTSPAWQ
jgi:hypothetical protein